MNFSGSGQSFEKVPVLVDTVDGDQVQARQKALLQSALLTLWRNRALLLAATVLGAFLGLAALVLMPKSYVADAVLQLDFSSDDVAKSKLPTGAAVEASALVEGEARLLRSRPMLNRVVRRLDLENDPEFAGKSSRPNWLANALGISNFQWNPYDRATATLSKAAAITNDNRSYLITVAVTASTPEKAALIANTIGYEYHVDRVHRRLKGAEGAAEGKLNELRLIFGEKHPVVQAATSELAAAQARTLATLRDIGVEKTGLPATLPDVIALPAQPIRLAVAPSGALPLIGAFLGLLASAGWALLGRPEFKTTRAELETAAITGERCYGTFAYVEHGGAACVDSTSPREVCAAAGLLDDTKSDQILAVTSVSEIDGRTRAASLLAEAAAEEGQRTLLIIGRSSKDTDNTSTTLDEILTTKKAMTGFLDSQTETLATVTSTYHTAAMVPDAFSSPAMLEFLLLARRHFHLIVLEIPAYLAASEPDQIARHSDSVVLVAEPGRTSAGLLKVGIGRLREAGARINGIILSRRVTSNAHPASFRFPMKWISGRLAPQAPGGHTEVSQSSVSDQGHATTNAITRHEG